jgi:hypothetical protein
MFLARTTGLVLLALVLHGTVLMSGRIIRESRGWWSFTAQSGRWRVRAWLLRRRDQKVTAAALSSFIIYRRLYTRHRTAWPRDLPEFGPGWRCAPDHRSGSRRIESARRGLRGVADAVRRGRPSIPGAGHKRQPGRYARVSTAREPRTGWITRLLPPRLQTSDSPGLRSRPQAFARAPSLHS